MTDNRYRRLGTASIQGHTGVGIFRVQQASRLGIGKGEGTTCMGIVRTPCLAPNATGRKVIHSWFHTLITQIVVRAERKEDVWSQLAKVGNKFCHFIDAPPKLIAQGKHGERGVMTVFAHDVFTLLMKEAHQHTILGIEITPEGQFWLQINAQFIGSNECSFWWTPRMEAHMIDTIIGTSA